MKREIKNRSKHLISILLLTVLLVSVGCGSMKSEQSASTVSSSESIEYDAQEKGMMDYDLGMEDSLEETMTDESVNAVSTNADLRKYIKTYRFYMETLDFEETETQLKQMVAMNFGFFQYAQYEGGGIRSSRANEYANYTIRIPRENLDDFISGLETIGNVVNSSEQTEDVTGQYYDIDARISTLKIQEERLLAILEEANDLEYIIELERELSNVRYQIENHESTMRRLEDQIAYSTIHVSLYEVQEETDTSDEPTTFFGKMGDGFMNSLDDVIDFFENLILFITTNSPVLLLVVITAIVVYKGLKRIVKKEITAIKKKTQKNDEKKEDNE